MQFFFSIFFSDNFTAKFSDASSVVILSILMFQTAVYIPRCCVFCLYIKSRLVNSFTKLLGQFSCQLILQWFGKIRNNLKYFILVILYGDGIDGFSVCAGNSIANSDGCQRGGIYGGKDNVAILYLFLSLTPSTFMIVVEDKVILYRLGLIYIECLSFSLERPHRLDFKPNQESNILTETKPYLFLTILILVF